MARPAHQPDDVQRRQVEALAGYGVPEAEIAALVGVDAKTLRKHYRHELDHGHTKANAKVAENLYHMALGQGREAVTAAIFWLKARARWKEVSVHEHGGVGDEAAPASTSSSASSSPRPIARNCESCRAWRSTIRTGRETRSNDGSRRGSRTPALRLQGRGHGRLWPVTRRYCPRARHRCRGVEGLLREGTQRRPHQGQCQGCREPLSQGDRRGSGKRHRSDLLAEDQGALEGGIDPRDHARRGRSALGAHAAHRRAGAQAP